MKGKKRNKIVYELGPPPRKPSFDLLYRSAQGVEEGMYVL
jgi:hypothetical protein